MAVFKHSGSLCFFALVLFQLVSAQGSQPKVPYENYSFDFSAHTRPLAYTTFGNTLELYNKVKLNPGVSDRGGAYVLDQKIDDKDFEVDLEFTVHGILSKTRGFMLILQQQEFLEEDFMISNLGYKQDYEGIGVYIFRQPENNKWYAMTLQNQGTRSALRMPDSIASGMKNQNHCEIDME